jgi:hypothetical protein
MRALQNAVCVRGSSDCEDLACVHPVSDSIIDLFMHAHVQVAVGTTVNLAAPLYKVCDAKQQTLFPLDTPDTLNTLISS